MPEEKNVVPVVEPIVTPEVDIIAEKDAEIARLREERENYKTVALKRLGKLDGDAEFMDKESGLTVEEQIKQALLERELAQAEKDKDAEIARIKKENAELRLAAKNQPSQPIGGSTGGTTETKDNVFTEDQLADLRKRALRLNADPEKFIENAKRNFRK